jgi:hypothetical protein
MQTELTGADIARKIRQTLRGEQTQPQLGQWAFKAMLNANTEAIPYEWHHRTERSRAIYMLMALDDMVAPGEPFEIEDSELEALADQLEGLA